jgi:hypothetical protein
MMITNPEKKISDIPLMASKELSIFMVHLRPLKKLRFPFFRSLLPQSLAHRVAVSRPFCVR